MSNTLTSQNRHQLPKHKKFDLRLWIYAVVLVFCVQDIVGQNREPIITFNNVIHFTIYSDQEIPNYMPQRFRVFESSKVKNTRLLLCKPLDNTLSDTLQIIKQLKASQFEASKLSLQQIDSLSFAFTAYATDTVTLPSRCVPVYRDF
jgi:hypothetical protein